MIPFEIVYSGVMPTRLPVKEWRLMVKVRLPANRDRFSKQEMSEVMAAVGNCIKSLGKAED